MNLRSAECQVLSPKRSAFIGFSRNSCLFKCIIFKKMTSFIDILGLLFFTLLYPILVLGVEYKLERNIEGVSRVDYPHHY